MLFTTTYLRSFMSMARNASWHTKRAYDKKKPRFLLVSRKKIKKNVRGCRLQRVGEKHEVHPLEGKEIKMVHLAQDVSGLCNDAQLSRNTSRTRVGTKQRSS